MELPQQYTDENSIIVESVEQEDFLGGEATGDPQVTVSCEDRNLFPKSNFRQERKSKQEESVLKEEEMMHLECQKINHFSKMHLI